VDQHNKNYSAESLKKKRERKRKRNLEAKYDRYKEMVVFRVVKTALSPWQRAAK